MDENSPLLKFKCKEKTPKNSGRDLWSTCQFIWIIIIHSGCLSATLLSMELTTQYIYSRVAKEHSVNTSDINTAVSPCNASTGNSTELHVIQAEAAQWVLLFSLSFGIPCVCANVILGANADAWGRKPFFILPTVGGLVRITILVVTVLWNLPLYAVAIGGFMEGVSGSVFVFWVASFSSIADMTDEGMSRTFPIAVIECVSGTMSGLVLIAGGYFIRDTGFLYPTVAILSVYVIGLFVQCSIIKETLRTQTYVSVKKRLRSMYQLFVGGEHRLIYLVCIAAFFLLEITNTGRGAVITLFTMDEPFCFSSVKIGWWKCVSMLVPGFGGILLLKLFQFCLSDEIIVLISILSNGGSNVLLGLAKEDYLVYLVPVAGTMSALSYPLMRGILSRMTDAKHQGALFGGFSTIEGLSFVCSGALLNLIYEKTVHTFPGAVFLVIAGICAVVFLLFVIVVIRKRKIVKVLDEFEEPDMNPNN